MKSTAALSAITKPPQILNLQAHLHLLLAVSIVKQDHNVYSTLMYAKFLVNFEKHYLLHTKISAPNKKKRRQTQGFNNHILKHNCLLTFNAKKPAYSKFNIVILTNNNNNELSGS